MGWVQPGWVQPGWVESDFPTAPPPTGVVSFLWIEQGGATPAGSGAITAVQVPRLYADLIVVLATPAGVRLFGDRMIRDSVVTDPVDIGRFSTLLRMTGLDLRTVPIGTDLIASLAAAEAPSVQLEFSNDDGFWTMLVMQEPIVFQPIGLWADWGETEVYQIYRGEVSNFLIDGNVVHLEVGEI